MSSVKYAIIKFDDRNRFGKNGVPASLLFAAGQRVIVSMKDQTIEKAGKRNRFAKVVVPHEGAEQAELIELLGPVGEYSAEMEAYQLHFGIKPCRYPKPAEWALCPLAEPPPKDKTHSPRDSVTSRRAARADCRVVMLLRCSLALQFAENVTEFLLACTGGEMSFSRARPSSNAGKLTRHATPSTIFDYLLFPSPRGVRASSPPRSPSRLPPLARVLVPGRR